MRLYLSSFRIGDHPEELLRLLGDGRRVAVIANAIDGAFDGVSSADVRADGVRLEVDALSALGVRADEVDLRDYFDGERHVADTMAVYDGLWVRGGNAFVLRAAMARSGADTAIRELVEGDAIVYAGYSAGPCVLAPSLRGLELVDHPEEVSATYGGEPIWDGLGLIDFAFVPHYRSIGHPETDDIDKVVARYHRDGTPHRTLRDGEVLVVAGDETRLI
jgi:dipeptidase E